MTNLAPLVTKVDRHRSGYFQQCDDDNNDNDDDDDERPRKRPRKNDPRSDNKDLPKIKQFRFIVQVYNVLGRVQSCSQNVSLF